MSLKDVIEREREREREREACMWENVLHSKMRERERFECVR